jgi:hypothetical protein
LGRGVRKKELDRLINRGVSDYSLRLQLTRKKGFRRSPMYRTLAQQASDVVGFNYKPPPRAIRQALKSEGGLSADSYRAALARNQKVQRAVTQNFMATEGQDVNYYLGAFGNTGAPTASEQRALALQASGLRETAMGRRLTSAFETAMQRAQRTFQGTLAQPAVVPQNTQVRRQQEDLDLPA